MGKKHTIIINGHTYDAKTGLALSEKTEKGANPKVIKSKTAEKSVASVNSIKKGVVQDIAPKKRTAQAKTMHKRTQRSKTLKRSPLQKPTPSKAEKITVNTGKKYARSPKISKFGNKPSASPKSTETTIKVSSEPPKPASKVAPRKSTQPVSSRAIKEQLIKEQMEKAPAARVTIEKVNRAKSKEISPSKLRTASVITVCFSLLLLAGYLTYLSIPNLSMRIAAMQTGVNAKLPEYKPQGYQMAGPASYADEQVKVGYKSDFGNRSYEISQTSSDWDSFATLDNFVSRDSNQDYQIRSKQGLTIYTYGNKAVWVNGGVLHVLRSNHAPLTSQQIEQIAISM